MDPFKGGIPPCHAYHRLVTDSQRVVLSVCQDNSEQVVIVRYGQQQVLWQLNKPHLKLKTPSHSEKYKPKTYISHNKVSRMIYEWFH